MGFPTDDWHPVSVPATVFAGLVANGEYPEPYYGDNLFQGDSSWIPLSSWWYRTEFVLADDFGPALFLALDGINYRANVWLNGMQVANADEVVGTFTAYEWDVSRLVHAGANALAIEVLPPDLQNDLALSWFDWNPAPPDLDMGIWQSVYLKESRAVALRDVHVTSALNEGGSSAELAIEAWLVNTTFRRRARDRDGEDREGGRG
ncbi:MAG: beta galactosidase jelly roll domain-containing protein [Myxococcales bacterium]